jgi:hypothetical protein
MFYPKSQIDRYVRSNIDLLLDNLSFASNWLLQLRTPSYAMTSNTAINLRLSSVFPTNTTSERNTTS